MKKVALYIRVSSAEQIKGFSIDAQKERLINYAKAKGWNIVDIYIDGAFSGANINRPALQKMLSELDQIDVVAVFKLDRLSRSQKDTLYLIEDVFLENNVDFVSLSESFDTSTPFGRAMIGILSVFAQLERENIRERSKLGKEKRAKEGLWKGGGHTPFGYDFIDDKLVINEHEAYTVRKIFELYLQGHGYTTITRKLMKMGLKTKYNKNFYTKLIQRILTNRTYTGVIKHNDEVFEGNHEPIITEEIFNEAQKIRISKKGKRTSTKYLLSGLLHCKYCGARLRASWTTAGNHPTKYYHYLCYSVVGGPPHMVKDKYCPGRAWGMDKLDQMVVDKLRHYQFNPDMLKEIYNSDNKDNHNKDMKKVIGDKIKEVDKKINKLMELYMDDSIPVKVVSEKINVLQSQKEDLLTQYDSIEEIKVNEDFEEYLEILKDFDRIWNNATKEEQKLILNGLVKDILVDKDDIYIEWNL